MDNILYGKTIIWDGDSICAGSEEKGNWATRIAKNNEMIFKNYAVGGGTLAKDYPLTLSGSVRHSVCATLDRMHDDYPDADYIIIEGGTNDADLIADGEADNISVGDFDKWDFSGNYNEQTVCGALESIFCRCLKYWHGKKIGFIVAHKMGTTPERLEIRRSCFDKAVEICRKWGIPYLDLWEGCYLNPCIDTMYDRTKNAEENSAENTGFYTDGQHLTNRGYDFTAEIIEKWLRTL